MAPAELASNGHATARHYRTGQPITVRWAAGQITEVVGCDPSDLTAAGSADVWIAPGLVDLQVNGYRGVSFTSDQLTVDQVHQVAGDLASRGTTRLLATLTTAPAETFDRALSTLAAARRDGPEWLTHMLSGVHLEGPFLSPEDGPRGAHPRSCCRTPDWDQVQRWQEIAEGVIRLITLAPELPGAVDLIRRATQANICVALGHTQATSAQIEAAVDVGARLSTHLGNGAHAVLPRHPNYLWDQLAEDRLSASLIVDGHHLPAAVVRTALRAKGLDRSLLVSDLTALGGMPAGRYDSTQLGSVEVLDDGRLVVAGQRQYLAGASRHLIEDVEILSQLGEAEWWQAWDLASANPSRLMGWDGGRLEAGQSADLVLLRHGLDSAEPRGAWPRPCHWHLLGTWIAGWVHLSKTPQPAEAGRASG